MSLNLTFFNTLFPYNVYISLGAKIGTRSPKNLIFGCLILIFFDIAY